eukprot:3298746-Pleurochrysis_carterae.AAC.1
MAAYQTPCAIINLSLASSRLSLDHARAALFVGRHDGSRAQGHTREMVGQAAAARRESRGGEAGAKRSQGEIVAAERGGRASNATKGAVFLDGAKVVVG